MGENKPVGFIYTEDYNKYNFGEGHPLTPLRIEMTYHLMEQYGLLDNPNLKILQPQKATEEQVLRVHEPQYINKLKEISQMENTRYLAFPEFGLGPGDNPVFPYMYDAALMVCGASIKAADYLMENEDHVRAQNIVGGLHHAMPDMASGFCILNDVAVAIAYIKSKRPDSKVLYVDIDCHHGDGVQWIFYDRPDVLTLSFHQDGKSLFPGTGFLKETGKGDGKGYALNFPFLPRTPANVYVSTFREILPAIMSAYEPDYIVFQTGVDTHFTDPLTQMGLTTSAHEKLFKIMLDTVSKYSADNLLVLGGGGYNIDVVARSWTLFLACLLDEDIGEPLPDKWLSYLKKKWDEHPPPEKLRDRYPYMERRRLKDPYFFDEMQIYCDKIIDKFYSKLIPNIK